MSNWPVVVMILAHNDGTRVKSAVVEVSGTTEDLNSMLDAMNAGIKLNIHAPSITFYNGRNYRPIGEYTIVQPEKERG